MSNAQKTIKTGLTIKQVHDAAYEAGAAKMLKACGGCDICYGKGYSTQLASGGRRAAILPCKCSRGKRIASDFLRWR